MGRILMWKDCFCGDDSASSVQVMDTGEYGSMVSSSSALTNQSRRTRGGKGDSGGHWRGAPDRATVDTAEVKV